VRALPAGPETVACYVADLAKVATPATIDLRLAAISAAHRAAGHDSPTKEEAVRLVRRGVRRTLGTAQRQVRPVTVPELRTMLGGLGTDPAGCRNRALLLLGFAGAMRRSEPRRCRCHRGRRRSYSPPSALEDRPRRRRTHNWHPLRVEPANLPGPCLARLA
jgi:integrase